MSDTWYQHQQIKTAADRAASNAAYAAAEAHAGRVAAEGARTAAEATRSAIEAEAARRREVERRRELLFQYRASLSGLAPQVAGDPAGVYHWLAEQRAFLAEAVPAAEFPELADKTFHAETGAAFAALERDARARLAPDQVAAIDRVAHLERVVPRLRRYAAWRDVRDAARGWRHTYNFNEQSTVRQVLAAVVGGFFFTACAQGIVDMASPALGKLVVLAGYGVIAMLVAQALAQPALLRTAAARLAAVGEQFPRGLSDGQVGQRVAEQRAELARLGVPAAALEGDAQGELARLRHELHEVSTRALGRPSHVASLA